VFLIVKLSLPWFVYRCKVVCMATQHGSRRGNALTDQYSLLVWLAAGLVGLLTVPVGLLVPGYFYMKTNNETAVEQTTLEIWTVILLGIFGIAAVELGGRNGAKLLWGAATLVFVLLIIGLAYLTGLVAL